MGPFLIRTGAGFCLLALVARWLAPVQPTIDPSAVGDLWAMLVLAFQFNVFAFGKLALPAALLMMATGVAAWVITTMIAACRRKQAG